MVSDEYLPSTRRPGRHGYFRSTVRFHGELKISHPGEPRARRSMNKTSFCVVSLIIYAGTRWAVARAKIDVAAACKYLVLIYIEAHLCARGTILTLPFRKTKSTRAVNTFYIRTNEFLYGIAANSMNRIKYRCLPEINIVQIVKCTWT